MAEVGRPLDPWQAAIVRDAHGIQDDGLWSAFELLLLVARQNGKGGVTEAIELGGLFLLREPLILHSAHQFKTSTAAFRKLQDIIDGSDWLSRRVKMISRSKGDESIELTRAAGGARLQFVARTLGSGRGLTGSTNVFDEAFALTVGQYAAQTPTLATIRNPRIIYTSTPPDEDTGPMPDDAMLPAVRERGHAGTGRIACYEWSPEPGYDVDDPDVWYDCNPALGIRIAEWFLRQQLDAFRAVGRPGKFSTEHLGEWPPTADEQWLVISQQAWQDASDADSTREGAVAMAIETSEDRRWTCIAIAGRRADGGRHIEVIESRPGTGWLVERVVELRDRHKPCAIAIRPHGPAASLIADLETAGVELMRISPREEAAAAGLLYDAIAGETPDLHHRGQGVLTVAVAAAVRRRTAGGAWTWGERSSHVDISPLRAATHALHAHAVHGAVVVEPPQLWAMYA